MSTIRMRRDLALILGVAACSVLVPVIFLPNWDVAWHFEMAQRLLEGERLYENIVDVNLPWAIYGYLPFVYLSNLFGGSPLIWLGCLVAILALLALVVAEQSEFGARTGQGWRWTWARVGIAVVLVVLPAVNFGKLEHFAVLLTLPYLLARLNGDAAPDDTEFGILVVLSVIAGIGFSLKPHFGLPWLVTQVVVTRRQWSPRNILLIGLTALPMAIQLLAIPIQFPDLVRLYQLFGRQYAAFWHLPPYHVLVDHLYLPAAAMVMIGSAGQVQPTRRLLVRGLAWIGLAWIITGVVQGKGWSYHFLPASMTLVLCGLFTILYFDGSIRGSAVRGLITVSVVLIGMAGLRSGVVSLDYPARRSQLPASLRDASDGMRALVLSVRMVTAYPLLNELNARNVGSFPTVWPLQVEYGQAGLPGRFVPVRSPGDMTEPESILFQSVVDDLVQSKPELVLVSDGTDPLFNDAYFDYVAYFSQNEAFKNEMSGYVVGPKLGHVRFYIRSDSSRQARSGADRGPRSLKSDVTR
ncbi:MAG: hypothetical protein JJE01_02080 [Gemmatimonadetes bacterium]|nr:hypothetical protein [Gemmatimonadota bacterium]